MNDAWPSDIYEEQYWHGSDDDDYCDHSDADLDWEGYWECPCGERWDATVEEIEAYWKAYDDANRPPTLWDRVRDRWFWTKKSVAHLFRSRKQRELDDDVPF